MAGPTPVNPWSWIKSYAGLFDAVSGGAAVTTDAAAIARAADQSGNGHDWIQTTSGNRPILKLAQKNGLPAIRADGTDDYLQCAANAIGGAFTVVAVWRQNTYKDYPSLVGAGNNWIALGAGPAASHQLASHCQGISTANSGLVQTSGTFNIVSWRSIGVVDGGCAVATRRDGTHANGVSMPTDFGLFAASVPTISYLFNGNTACDLIELLVYDRVLTIDELQAVEAYLSTVTAIAVVKDPKFTFSPAGFRNWRGSPTPIIVRGGAGADDELHVEVADAKYYNGFWYVWYVGWRADGNVAKILWAKGPTLETLVKQGVALQGTAAAWDAGYVSGPRVNQFGTKWYLDYFGSPNTGFEAQPSSAGIAVADTPDGPWVKSVNNPTIVPSVAAIFDHNAVYRIGTLKRGGTYYKFYNASGNGGGGPGAEAIGLVTGTGPEGPFTKDPSSPVLITIAGGEEATRIGDPIFLYDPVQDLYIMFYFGQTDPDGGRMFMATATGAAFPYTWTRYSGNWMNIISSSPGLRSSIVRVGNSFKMILDDLDQVFQATLDVPTQPSRPDPAPPVGAFRRRRRAA